MREWLKKSREERKMTQQDVSERLGITRQYYNQIETGIRQLKMDITLISKLSVILEISIEQVIENENVFLNSVLLTKAQQKNNQGGNQT